jgi:hypothetical protein
MGTRAISEDGSRIVFVTAAPLSVDAINGQENVYVWHKEPGWAEGRVSMLSSGSSLTSDKFPVMTPSGRDVFFDTTAGLVPQDTEGDLDVYDARIGGGFPAQPAEREQCSSDACQGALTNPAPLFVPGSISQAPGENLSPPPLQRAAAKTAPKLTRAQQLTRALKACAKRPKSKRSACRRRARKRYGKAGSSAVRGGR